MTVGDVWKPDLGGHQPAKGVGRVVGALAGMAALNNMTEKGRDRHHQREMERTAHVAGLVKEDRADAVDQANKFLGHAVEHGHVVEQIEIGQVKARMKAAEGGKPSKPAGPNFRYPVARKTATAISEHLKSLPANYAGSDNVSPGDGPEKVVKGNAPGGNAPHTHVHQIDTTFHKVTGTVQDPETKKFVGAKKAYVRTHYPEGSPLRDRVENPPPKKTAQRNRGGKKK